LKSNAATFGAGILAERSAAVESAAAEGDLVGAEGAITEIEIAFEAASTALRAAWTSGGATA
jgi:hypothetical protein